MAVPSLAITPASAGNDNVTSAVDAAPTSVTLFEPLSLSSKNSMKPADVAPFFTDIPALNTSFAAEVDIPVCVVAPVIVVSPLISTAPLISIKVELSSISSSALMSKSPSAGEPILIAESLN